MIKEGLGGHSVRQGTCNSLCVSAGKKGAGGGKKKKGLSLTPEQTVHLVRITGCLKFLSLLNTNRYRIAKLGALKVGGVVP